MNKHQRESISLAAARALRGGRLPHVAPPASPVKTRVRLDLDVPEGTNPEVVLNDPNREHGWRVAMEPGPEPGRWSAEILLPQEPTLLFYHFELADGTQIRERRQREGVEKPLFGVWEEQEFRIAVYLPDGAPPDWVRGQVFYQIFPDRFARSGETPRRTHTYQYDSLHLPWGAPPEHPPHGRDFFGGNLRGVIDHLDNLSDLGVTCIYFTPIFTSPTNHRYDAIDYHEIDPQLGTLDDFTELMEKAGERGMRVLLDGVFNHCSSESIYFKAAQADVLSPYYRWFEFAQWPEAYQGWVGVKTMPEFVECPEVEEFFFGTDETNPGVALHWLAKGTAGWRTDVTPWITDEYWRRFRRTVRRAFPEAYLVAEDWGDASKRLLGNTFDATMNYRFGYTAVGFAAGKLNPLELDDRLETLRRDTPPGAFNAQMNLIDSHDTPRAFTLLKRNRKRLMLAAGLMLAYPGAPMICYGDEAGLEGDYAENSRRAFPWDDPDQVLMDFYRRGIRVRRASQALSLGDVQTAWIDDQGGYAFWRCAGSERVLAAFNNGRKPVEMVVPLPSIEGAGEASEWVDLLGRLPNGQAREGSLHVTLPSGGVGWFAPG